MPPKLRSPHPQRRSASFPPRSRGRSRSSREMPSPPCAMVVPPPAENSVGSVADCSSSPRLSLRLLTVAAQLPDAAATPDRMVAERAWLPAALGRTKPHRKRTQTRHGSRSTVPRPRTQRVPSPEAAGIPMIELRTAGSPWAQQDRWRYRVPCPAAGYRYSPILARSTDALPALAINPVPRDSCRLPPQRHLRPLTI